jgi:hypothetical protein
LDGGWILAAGLNFGGELRDAWGVSETEARKAPNTNIQASVVAEWLWRNKPENNQISNFNN